MLISSNALYFYLMSRICAAFKNAGSLTHVDLVPIRTILFLVERLIFSIC